MQARVASTWYGFTFALVNDRLHEFGPAQLRWRRPRRLGLEVRAAAQFGEHGIALDVAFFAAQVFLRLARHERGVIGIPLCSDALHQVGKLESLLKKLLAIVLPTDTVVDPFMGSAITSVAALRAGHHFTGIEMSEGYYGVAEERLRDEERRLAE